MSSPAQVCCSRLIGISAFLEVQPVLSRNPQRVQEAVLQVGGWEVVEDAAKVTQQSNSRGRTFQILLEDSTSN